MNCQNCNEKLHPGAQFCGNCGAQIMQPVQPAQQPVQTQTQNQTAQPIQPAQPTEVAQTQASVTAPQQAPMPIMAAPAQSATQPYPTQPLQPGQPGFPGVSVAQFIYTDKLRSSVKNFWILNVILGILYIVGSIILYVILYSLDEDPTIFLFMPIDIILGLGIFIPALLARNTQDPKKLKSYVTTTLICLIVITVLSLLSGKAGGILVIIGLIFSVNVLRELKAANGS